MNDQKPKSALFQISPNTLLTSCRNLLLSWCLNWWFSYSEKYYSDLCYSKIDLQKKKKKKSNEQMHWWHHQNVGIRPKTIANRTRHTYCNIKKKSLLDQWTSCVNKKNRTPKHYRTTVCRKISFLQLMLSYIAVSRVVGVFAVCANESSHAYWRASFPFQCGLFDCTFI